MKKLDLPTFAEIDQSLKAGLLTTADFEAIETANNGLFIENGKVKTLVGKRAIKQNIAFIDWLNFTVKDITFTEKLGLETAEDSENKKHGNNELIIHVSRVISQIFGFGISTIRQNGLFFYDRSYELGNKYGHVCHGGQNGSILISLNGTGLAHASEGWENRLFIFLKSSVAPSITRIDLAHDDFNPTFFTVDNCLSEYLKGSFKNGKRQPSVSQAGNWIQPDGKGRTLYIGRRTNGMFCRIYEKGLQLGSLDLPMWVRCEVELKSVDRIIPLEVLLKPPHFFAGSFPIFNVLSQVQTRVETYQHEVRADIDHRTKWAKRQTGSFIELLSQIGFNNDEIIQKLKSKKLPPKFKQKFLENDLQNIHEQSHQAIECSNTGA